MSKIPMHTTSYGGPRDILSDGTRMLLTMKSSLKFLKSAGPSKGISHLTYQISNLNQKEIRRAELNRLNWLHTRFDRELSYQTPATQNISMKSVPNQVFCWESH